MRVAHISTGGKDYEISVGEEIFCFEMHPYCGPIILDTNGQEAVDQPINVLKAISLWNKQGRKFKEGGRCKWFHERETITEKINSKNFRVVGHKEAVEGN